MRLWKWWQGTAHPLELADAGRVEAMRPEIDAFLRNVLAVEEHEHIDSYFISDEATLFDCSLGMPEDWQRNCQKAYGVELSRAELKLSLWRLVELAKDRAGPV